MPLCWIKHGQQGRARKTKDEPEKVMKQWEQERQPEGVLSKKLWGAAQTPEHRQREGPEKPHGGKNWARRREVQETLPKDSLGNQAGQHRTEETRKF